MKKFIAGLIVGLLFTNTFAFAGDSISAAFAKFNFVINGQAKTVDTQPIVYNGTSYLPVRELSTMLGYDVDYKADTRTIELKTASQIAPSSNQNNSVISNNFIDLNTLSDNYGISTLWGNEAHVFFKGSIETSKKINFDVPSIKDGIYTITTDYGTFTLKMDNSRAFIKVDEISNLFKALDQ